MRCARISSLQDMERGNGNGNESSTGVAVVPCVEYNCVNLYEKAYAKDAVRAHRDIVSTHLQEIYEFF